MPAITFTGVGRTTGMQAVTPNLVNDSGFEPDFCLKQIRPHLTPQKY